jgi:hypothetical protein
MLQPKDKHRAGQGLMRPCSGLVAAARQLVVSPGVRIDGRRTLPENWKLECGITCALTPATFTYADVMAAYVKARTGMRLGTNETHMYARCGATKEAP